MSLVVLERCHYREGINIGKTFGGKQLSGGVVVGGSTVVQYCFSKHNITDFGGRDLEFLANYI